MLEAGVVRAGIDVVGGAELADAPQALHLGRVQQGHLGVSQVDVPVDCVSELAGVHRVPQALGIVHQPRVF